MFVDHVVAGSLPAAVPGHAIRSTRLVKSQKQPFDNRRSIMVTRLPCLARGCVFFLLAFGISTFTAQAQQQVVLGASKDNTLVESATGNLSNGAGEFFFAGRTNQSTGSIRRGVIAFNIAGSIPGNATITGVTLTLSMSKTVSGNNTVSLHRATADWGQGTSNAGGNEGGGAPATTNDATWLHRFFNTQFWTTPGGTYASTPSASQTVGAIGFYTWGSTAAMVSDVQQWLTSPSSNFGWVIIGNESAPGTSKRFDTRENKIGANQPKLTVTYTVPNSVEEQNAVTFVLHQNYPNPFNPVTTIGFELAKAGRVSLKIFNLLGQEAATLVDEERSAGSHTVEWDAANFSTGVYVYRLQAGGTVATRKLVLAR
jgi:hypothetical protein